jgi:POT family proton-dependent oligopeptide transporter
MTAASAMMGVWFMSGVLGNYLAGVMGSYWERLPKSLFGFVVAIVPLVAGCIVLSLRGYLERIVAEQVRLDSGVGAPISSQ